MGIATRVNGQAPPHVPLADINLGTLEFWGLDDEVRDGAFATPAARAPITFFHEIEFDGFPGGAGHWALMKFDDALRPSRHPEIFSSYPNITIGDQAPEVAEYFGSMIALDDPRHARLRNIVRSAFTPKVVARTEESVRDRAPEAGGRPHRQPSRRPRRTGDRAPPLPLQVICDMMGIPESDHHKILPLDQHHPRLRRPRPQPTSKSS